MRIGVDVGGTNTDAVLIDGRRVIAAEKRPTTADVSSGIRAAIQAVLNASGAGVDAIHAVMIGTTHFTNAFIQAAELAPVTAIRIGLPAAREIPPFAAWPDRLRAAVQGSGHMVRGGFEFDGREIGPLDELAVAEIARGLPKGSEPHVAITGVFSQLNMANEQRAAEIVRNELPDASITISSELGRTGLIERENAAIMNASLRPLADRVSTAFAQALLELGITAPFFVSQNDGTLMSADHMRRYPVLTFAAGPTNSLRGAAFLTGLSDALVADIGGTTTDIGVLISGFPRQSSRHVDIGGVRTNFRMPDILSLGLGGGSRVRAGEGAVSVGPDSVGFRLTEEALIFGGKTLTASDIAVAAGRADFGDARLLSHLGPDLVADALAAIRRIVEDGLDRMKTSAAAMPLILVGGGAVLVDGRLAGTSETITPEGAGVANAVGAAIGQVSGEIDRIYNVLDMGREAALDDARGLATARAIEAGARPDSVAIVDLEDLPLQYLPGGATRIVCRAVGDLDALRERADA